MDLQMPGLGGVEATRRLLAEQPGTAVLVVTMDSDDASVFAALKAGARGYLVKDASGADIARAVETRGPRRERARRAHLAARCSRPPWARDALRRRPSRS